MGTLFRVLTLELGWLALAVVGPDFVYLIAFVGFVLTPLYYYHQRENQDA